MTASSAPEFDFAAPFPPTKQRRVSLALPASTPRVPWDFRDDTGIAGPSNAPQQSATESAVKEPRKTKKSKPEPQDPSAPLPEKKPRKKWSPEETQMLVEGCNRHGVGNWKTILSDPTLKFDSRSPVDLKDRFRTYFPDAYKKHYPNARTHLSSKVRSTLPDGSSLFEKTRSKRRRPFTEEEDRALKAGYEKHGTVWATIVKDPVFQEQNRRSTDLRDRFRNAFPELYQAAGYKPRNTMSKKKKEHLIDDSRIAGRAATDDQLPVSSSGTTGPVRGVRRRRAQTSQGILLRGGTKSVPQSTAPSEDEDSSGQEDEDGEMNSVLKQKKVPATPLIVDQPSMTDGIKNLHIFSPATTVEAAFPAVIDDDDEMGMRLIALEPLSSDPLAEYPSSQSTLDSQLHPRTPRNPIIETPTHTHHPTWSSPQPGSHGTVNDGGGGGSNPPRSSTTANNNPHAHAQVQTAQLKVGQSPWAPQDWLSPNPRLDPSSNPSTNANSNNANATGNSTPGTGTPSSYFSPSSPFTSFSLPPLNTTHPLSPSTTAATAAGPSATTANSNNNAGQQNGSSTAAAHANPNSLVGNLTQNLTTLNLPMNYIPNFYNSHQHHGVIERYDLWPPSTSALALSSSFSAVNNSSAWSSALSGSGGGPFSGPGSLSAFSSSFGGDLESEVSFEDTHSQTFSDDREHEDAVFGNDGTYNMGYPATATAAGNGTGGAVYAGTTRAITHHSDYAGDLIFGARGYGIGGGFGWFGSAYAPTTTNGHDDPHSTPADGIGLGLVGIPTTKDGVKGGVEGDDGRRGGDNDDNVVIPGDGKGSINPMQLHAPVSAIGTGAGAGAGGIEEMNLAGITLNDSPRGVEDVDEEMSDAAMEEDDDAMDGSRASSTSEVEGGLISGKTPSPEKQQQRQNVVNGKSSSADASPVVQNRRIGLGASGGHTMSSLSPHLHAQQHHLHLHHGHLQQHQHHAHHTPPHTHTHTPHSLSLSLGPSTTFSPPSTSLSTPGLNSYGRFSLDDLDLVDLTQNALADMNNLTPPATPMMQHATQLRGGRKYSVFGLGLGGGNVGCTGAAGGGGGLFMPQGPGQQEQGQNGTRSTSVPPSEARNGNASVTNASGLSFNPTTEVIERGRGRTSQVSTGGTGALHPVKRSLSSTVHHSHGHGPSSGATTGTTSTTGTHGHSLSLSTLPPLPSHSEIWRSSTPVAKTSSSSSLTGTGAGTSSVSNARNGNGGGTGGGGGAGVNSPTSTSTTPSTAGTTTPGATSSLFNNIFSFNGATAAAAAATGGIPSNNINPDVYANAGLPFLDLHYNFGNGVGGGGHLNSSQQQQQQMQQNFGAMAMLVDTPATTPGIPVSLSTSSSGVGAATTGTGAGTMLTQAEVEARQALDLAQLFYFHHSHGPGGGANANGQQQVLHHLGLHPLSEQQQQTQSLTGFGFGSSPGGGGRGGAASGGGLKLGAGGNGFVTTTPLSLTRQLSQFSSAATMTRVQQQQQQQRVQGQQQVVNPKDLVLNANGAGGVGGESRLESRRLKRASWDGGLESSGSGGFV